MKAEQREYIIELALKMFIGNGVKAVTMSEIASAAGISKRTLYEEFGQKEELLYLVADDYYNKRVELLNQLVMQSDNILIGMMKVIEAIVANSDVNWRFHRSIKASYPMVDRRFKDRESDSVKGFVERLSQGVEQGLVSPRSNLELSIVMLHQMASNLVQEEMFELPQGATTQDAFRELFINFMRGIATARGVEIIDEYISNR